MGLRKKKKKANGIGNMKGGFRIQGFKYEFLILRIDMIDIGIIEVHSKS